MARLGIAGGQSPRICRHAKASARIYLSWMMLDGRGAVLYKSHQAPDGPGDG